MPNQVQHLTISEDDAGQRLDNYLMKILKGAPKSLIYRIIRKGEVRINKGRVKPERKLLAGDLLRVPPVRLDQGSVPAKPGAGLSQRLLAATLYEDKDLLIINKPSGLAVHGGSGIHLGLVEALRQIREEPTLELVHRLDRDTSGCIVLARKRSVLRQLHQKLRDETGMDKRYLALVKGHWSRRKSSINVPLRKNELQSGERVVCVDSGGKASKTLFNPITYFQGATLVQAKPITGRTHQIRVHAQYAKHPLVGDDKYGDDEFNKTMKAYGIRRLFLHASALSFSLDNGKTIAVEAPLPEDLSSGLNKLPTEGEKTMKKE